MYSETELAVEYDIPRIVSYTAQTKMLSPNQQAAAVS